MVKEVNLITLRAALGDLPLGGIRYFQTVNSTNDLAIAWQAENAPDMSLVVADEQTSGRGRNGHHWYSPAGGSLSFSLILHLEKSESRSFVFFSFLGALAVVDAIDQIDVCLKPKIKWPNDVLLNNKKVCGVLTEASWIGDQIESLVLGVGVNVSPESVLPAETLNFPATCLENLTQSKIERLDLLHNILMVIVDWRKRMDTSTFIDALQDKLAYRGEMVTIWSENSQPRAGVITGLDSDGGLCLQETNGQIFKVHYGEVHLKQFRL
ncbi:MAG: biotin--[acetyl-CoA-carboxylase] ligase [Chloroflexota bacterium]